MCDNLEKCKYIKVIELAIESTRGEKEKTKEAINNIYESIASDCIFYNKSMLEIKIVKELTSPKITVAKDRITYKFRSIEERDLLLEKFKKLTDKVLALNFPLTLRARYSEKYPDTVQFITSSHHKRYFKINLNENDKQ